MKHCIEEIIDYSRCYRSPNHAAKKNKLNKIFLKEMLLSFSAVFVFDKTFYNYNCNEMTKVFFICLIQSILC